MDLFNLKNKAAKDISRDEIVFAVKELKAKNETLELVGVVEENGLVLANVNVLLENSGQVNEILRLGQLINVIDSGTSVADLIDGTNTRNNELAAKRKKNDAIKKKRKVTRQRNKPENNIFKNDKKVLFAEMMEYLKEHVIEINRKRGERESYDSKFISSVCVKLETTQQKLTSKQHNYLCKVASKYGFSMSEKVVRAKKKNSNTSYLSSNFRCEHDDLGSLGHVHGAKAICPQCGELAEVW